MSLKNKKLQLIFVGILILIVGIGIGFWMGKVKYAVPDGTITTK